MSGSIKRFVLSMIASKLQGKAHHGHNPAAHGLLGEINHRLGRAHHYGQYGHPSGHGAAGPYGHGGGYPPPGYPQPGYPQPGFHGHYRQRGHHGHYKQRGGYHGHYRQGGFHGHYKKRRHW